MPMSLGLQVALEILSAAGAFALVAMSLFLLGGAQRRVCASGVRSFMDARNPLEWLSIGFVNTVVAADSNSVSSTLFGYSYSKMIGHNGVLYSLLGIAIAPIVTVVGVLLVLQVNSLYYVALPFIGIGFAMILISYKARSFARMIMALGMLIFALYVSQGAIGTAIFRLFSVTGDLFKLTSFGVPAILLGCGVGTIFAVIFRSSFLATIFFTILLKQAGLGMEFIVGGLIGAVIGVVFVQAPIAVRAGTNAFRAVVQYFVGIILGIALFCLLYKFVFSVVVGQSRDLATFQVGAISMFGAFVLFFLPIGVYLSNFLTKLVFAIIPNVANDNSHLAMLSNAHRPDATLSLLQAQKEIANHIRRTYKMVSFLRDMVNEFSPSEPNDTHKMEKIDKLYERIKKYKNITDRVENEIVGYICSVAQGDISRKNTLQMQEAIVSMGKVNQVADSVLACANYVRGAMGGNHCWDESQIETLCSVVHSLQLLQYGVISSIEGHNDDGVDVLYENFIELIDKSNEKIYLYNQVLMIESMSELKKTGKLLCNLAKK